MRLPKGTSYKFLSTKEASLDSVLEDLASEKFSGYLRMTIEGEKGIEDGYLLIKDGDVVGAEFEGGESLFSKKAYKKIKDISKLSGILDIYKFTEFQMQLSVEENGETLLSAPKKKPAEKIKEEPKAKPKPPEPVEVTKEREPSVEKKPAEPPPIEETKPPEPVEALGEPERSVEEDILEKRKERMAMLKKFGLKEPEDDFVDGILQTFKLPTEKEINKTSKALKKEILSRIKQKTTLEEVDLYIHSSTTEKAVGFSIDVYVKPFNKEIEEEVKSTIEDAMKEKLAFPYEKGLSINEASE
jgi:hypothetical protein